MELLKKCSKCQQIKSIDDFYKSGRHKLQSQCKRCCNRKRDRNNEKPRRVWSDNINQRLKECGGCDLVKPYSEFSKLQNGRLGLDDRCKLCRQKIRQTIPSGYQSDYYSRNPGKGREQREKYRKKNCDEWYRFLKERYGKNPECECCGKKLLFGLGKSRKSETVHFDHRHEGVECISDGPHSWMMNHACNRQNIAKFESCDFGVLCHGCNKMLPTFGRRRWLERAINYVKKTETCYRGR